MISVSSSKAGLISRSAAFLQYEQATGSIDVMNTQPVGSNTISQKYQGVEFPNVQSAIEDIRGFAILPIGSIVINDTGVSPEGIQQIDAWTFTGTVSVDGKNTGDSVLVDVYGFMVPATVGDTDTEFTAKAKTVLENAITAGEIISTVEVSSSAGNILNVKYIDNQQHVLPSYSSCGISVSASIQSPSKVGYGTWDLIGRQSLTFDGATSPTVLQYFKRVS
ncbi:baseplate wedge subunit and tail pin [Enterobacter phage vB-EclM_KMB17]|nr:baseplate wedge subunit and tail pin [Enterobacter phage vB-EclM_KMB17]